MRRAAGSPLVFGICVALVLTSNLCGAAPSQSREAVLQELEQVVSSGGGSANLLRVWVNDGVDIPLEAGTPVAFHFQSRENVSLAAFYLDADGKVALLYPGPAGTLLKGGTQLVLYAGEVTEPYGLESLFVVARTEPITREALGIDSMDAYVSLERDEALAAARALRGISEQGSSVVRVDLHIVPAKTTTGGYSRGGIVQYFTQATRSLHRPKLALEINFETGSAGLLDEVRGDLDVAGAALADHRLSDKRFRLVGHTDHRGDVEYNQILSEKRAEAARAYLVENYQIDPTRLEAVGLGESKPLMTGESGDAMRRNRRVELELVP